MKSDNNFKLLLGDCLEHLKHIPDESIDLVLTDPPYGMSYQSNRRVATDKFKKIANDTDLDWLPSFVEQTYRVMKQNTAAYIFCSWHNVDVFKQQLERFFTIKNLLVWVKTCMEVATLKVPMHLNTSLSSLSTRVAACSVMGVGPT